MILFEAKITGVHSSNKRVSEKAFMMSSIPMPFKSPQEIPIFGLLVGFIDRDYL
jgi:hypothetical protein